MPGNSSVRISEFRPQMREKVIKLWTECELVVPQNDPNRDIDRKVSHSPELFLTAEIEGELVGTIMCGYEGHRGWLNYLAVAPKFQNLGIGRKLVDAGLSLLDQAGCAKVNLQVRGTNKSAICFYKKLGFQTDDVLSLGLKLGKE
jgi:ribosomal protein S18 acetylase RimI-like enzyme